MMEPVSEALTMSRVPGAQGNYGDDELRSVAEGGVQEAADAFPGPVGDLLRGFPHPPRQRDDPQTGGKENQGVGLGPKMLQVNGERDKTEQHIQGKEEFQNIPSGGSHLLLL